MRAGNERLKPLLSEGSNRKEASFINKSLSTLSLLIKKLTEAATHLPYRDSKLTHLLQPCLGGNAKTTLVATIHPSAKYMLETHNTLQFAFRAKAVRNKVHCACLP